MRPKGAWTLSLLVLIAAGAVAINVGLHQHWVIAWLASANLITLLAFAYDKWRAGRAPEPSKRVPEMALLFCCIAGGTVGGIIAMVWRRHKTRDRRFQLRLAMIVMTQMLVIALVVWRLGAAG